MGVKLLEMHGIGPVIAGILISELLPVARAATEPQCATYAGVTPIGRKSGKALDTTRLARGVNKRILHSLYTSSVVAIKHSAVDRAYYNKKVRDYAGHPKAHVAALIALSRQRHKVIYKLMTTDAIYSTGDPRWPATSSVCRLARMLKQQLETKAVGSAALRKTLCVSLLSRLENPSGFPQTPQPRRRPPLDL